MTFRLVLVCAAALCCAAQEQSSWRLPGSVRPLRNEVELTINPASDTLKGRIAIDLELRANVSEVRLNALGIVPSEATWRFAGQSTPVAWRGTPDEQLVFALPQPAGPGAARIEIAYSAPVSDTLTQGPCRRKLDGAWYVFTTFTPSDARRAFPCFDEPGIKAPWKLTLRVPEALTAAANAPVTDESAAGAGWKAVHFAETAALPAEVAAFAVGPFAVVTGPPAGAKHVAVRVLAPRGRGKDAQAAAESSSEVLSRVEDYMGTPYPWAKLDHVALPEGTFGAVENPGLITYREGILLSPAPSASTDIEEWRRSMRGVMAHELVHQWFGNLVTQADWNEVYLSEGFATWLGIKTREEDQPVARRGVSAVEARNHSMRTDAGPHARPVRLSLRTRDELADAYDGVVYQKAASVLRMLEVWLGEQPMQRAARRYLAEHAGGVAVTSDLAKAIQEETGQDTSAVLAAFLDRVGYPSVTLTLDCNRGVQPLVMLQQAPAVPAKAAAPWPVPVCVRTPAGRSCTLLKTAYGSIALKDRSCPAWFAPNAEGAGYYKARVEASSVDESHLTPGELAAWRADH